MACLLVVAANSFAQAVKISGKITDAVTNQPVAYANVGVAGKALGTVANASGAFSFTVNLDKLATADKLVVSCVGYQPVELAYTFGESENLRIALNPQTVAIQEVSVKAGKLKEKVLGKNDREYFTHYNFYSIKDTAAHDRLGREVGNIISLNKACYLNDFNVYMNDNDFTAIKFRLNIYEVVNGLPGSSLLQEAVNFEVTGKNPGWVKVDLEKYKIHVENHDKIAVTVQWLESVKTNEKSRFLSIPAAVSPIHTAVTRDKSTEDWKRSAMYLSMYLNADCYKPAQDKTEMTQ